MSLSFKEFLALSEYAGDGNTSLNPQGGLTRPEGQGLMPGTHNDGNRDGNAAGAYVSSDVSGTEQPQHSNSHVPTLPSLDLITGKNQKGDDFLPTTRKSGQISNIDWFSNRNKSSIGITVKDQQGRTTDLNMTRSQYDKIKELNGGADPKPGDPASLLMLRHPSDKSRKSSNILGFGYGSKA